MQNEKIAELQKKITLIRSVDFMLNGFFVLGLLAAEQGWQFLLVILLVFVQGISFFVTNRTLVKDLSALQNEK